MRLTGSEHEPSSNPEEANEPAMMTDLAEALAGPDAQAVAAGLKARFDAADALLAADMDKGATPARFTAISAVRKGLHHAGQVLQAATAARTLQGGSQ